MYFVQLIVKLEVTVTVFLAWKALHQRSYLLDASKNV